MNKGKGYNLQLIQEQFAGFVPFIDSAHVRFNRGGITIDSASAIANRIATQGQVVITNNRTLVLAGSFIGLNPGTGRWEVYTPASGAVPAWLEHGVEADNNAIRWEAVNAGVAGNAITIELVDTRLPVQALVVNTAGNDIQVLLEAGVGGVLANGSTGAANSEILWESVLPGVDGNVITIDLVNDGTLGRAAIDVQVIGTSIMIFPVTDGATGVPTSAANDIIAEVTGHAGASALVTCAAGGTGADAVGGDSIVLAGGIDSVPVSTAEEVHLAVNADGAAGLLVQGADVGASDGSGVAVAIPATNLDSGNDAVANNITGRRVQILFTETDITDGNAVTNGIDHGRVIDARLPLSADATIRAALPQVTFV